MDDRAAAEEDDGGDREGRQVVEAGDVLRLDARLAKGCRANALGPVAETPAHIVLTAEGLHHLDPDDGLVRRLGHVALARLHLARDRRDAMSEAVGDQSDRRQRHGGVEGQLRIDDHEDDPGSDDHHHALDPLHQPPPDEVPDGVQVVRRPRQHLPGRVAVVERPRVAEVRLVEKLAHPRLDANSDPGGCEAAVESDDGADRRKADDDREVGPERLSVVTMVAEIDGIVDRVLDEDRDRDRDQRVDERARQSEDTKLPLLCPQPEQASEGRQHAEVGWVNVVHVRGHGETPVEHRPPARATRDFDDTSAGVR